MMSPRAAGPSGSGAGANSAEAAEAQQLELQEHQATVRSQPMVEAVSDNLTIQSTRA